MTNSRTEKSNKEERIVERRGGGQPEPKPASGDWKRWVKPENDSTPDMRGKRDRS